LDQVGPGEGRKVHSVKVKIVSWMGGEHWYIKDKQFLRLEEAIAFCERNGLEYEIVQDPARYERRDGD
jgi:hypothetical protein